MRMPLLGLSYVVKNSGDFNLPDDEKSDFPFPDLDHEKGNHHIQGYLRTTTRKRRIQVVRMLQSILPQEVAKWVSVIPSPNGSSLQDYCSKGKNIVSSSDFSNPYERKLQDSTLNPEQLETIQTLDKATSRQLTFWSDPVGCSWQVLSDEMDGSQ